jgi:hypothetical protein
VDNALSRSLRFSLGSGSSPAAPVVATDERGQGSGEARTPQRVRLPFWNSRNGGQLMGRVTLMPSPSPKEAAGLPRLETLLTTVIGKLFQPATLSPTVHRCAGSAQRCSASAVPDVLAFAPACSLKEESEKPSRFNG